MTIEEFAEGLECLNHTRLFYFKFLDKQGEFLGELSVDEVGRYVFHLEEVK